MASWLLLVTTCRLLLLLLLLASSASALNKTTACTSTFDLVFAFGDSTSDTGNAVLTTAVQNSNSVTRLSLAARPPYGDTFFHNPTGRFSDGRLMVDFLVSALGLPELLPPHLATALPPEDGSNIGENFAVAGATSLDVSVSSFDVYTLQQLTNATSLTPDSLSVQLNWFSTDISANSVNLSNALVYFGQGAGSEYNYAMAAQNSINSLQGLISPVMEKVATVLDEIMRSGVKKVVIQGQLPLGCTALYVTMLNGTRRNEYGCVASAMAVSDRHNQLLKAVISDLSQMHQDTEIVFLDTSAAYLHILENAIEYGFTNVLDPCYPPGLALFLPTNTTRYSDSSCINPEKYVSWDGIHPTDAMNGALMNLFLTNSNFSSPYPNFLSSCSQS